MTPEERHAKIDAHIARAAMHLERAASLGRRNDAQLTRGIDDLLGAAKEDAEFIRALANIAETRYRRRSGLEGGERKD